MLMSSGAIEREKCAEIRVTIFKLRQIDVRRFYPSTKKQTSYWLIDRAVLGARVNVTLTKRPSAV
jgi:hypothetical protein